MITKVGYTAALEVVEVLELGSDLFGNPSVTHKTGGVATASLTPASDPAVDAGWSDKRALVAGADAIDLTALARPGLTAVNLTGKRLRAVKIRANTENAAAITLDPAAATPADFPTVKLGPGDVALFIFSADVQGVIGAGAKSVEVAGTGTDGYEIVVAAG